MRGHIRQRGKRSWAIVLDLGRDSRGRRRQHWHTVRGTKKDAERELTKLLHELDTGGYVEPTNCRLPNTWSAGSQTTSHTRSAPKRPSAIRRSFVGTLFPLWAAFRSRS